MEYILSIVSIEALGDYQLALYAEKGVEYALWIGYLAYGVTLWLFVQAIKAKGLAWANSAWDGWSNIATGAVALFILKEKPTQNQLAGIALISAGLFLLGNKSTRNSDSFT